MEAAGMEEHRYTQAAMGRTVQGRQAHTDSMSKGLGVLIALPCSRSVNCAASIVEALLTKALLQ